MSQVPKSKRGYQKFGVIVEAQNLYKHTLLVTSNQKIFTENYKVLIASIVNTAEKIFINCYTANHVYVNSHESYLKRYNCQVDASLDCDNLLALVDLAYSMFHLRYKKIVYWIGLVESLSKSINEWKNKERQRYKEYL